MQASAFSRLGTERLVIRRFCDEDLASFVAYRNDPGVAQLQGWDLPYTATEAKEFIASLENLEPGTPGTWFQFAVVATDGDCLIGDIGLRTTRENPKHAELGFTLASAHQGQGYASEAVRAVLDFVFTALGMTRVFAITDATNDRARRLLERIDFQFEQDLGKDGVLYGMSCQSEG